MIVLDTNVISEFMRGPDLRSPVVAEWLRKQEPDLISTTALSVAEISVGVRGLPAGARRDVMNAAAERAFALFTNRILMFDRSAGALYGDLVATRKRAGRHREHVFDLQIAAIARSRGYAVATRNISDFADLGVEIINPWDHPAP